MNAYYTTNPLHPLQVYVLETWAAARRDIEEATNMLGLPAPEVVAIPFGMPIEECGLRLTGVRRVASDGLEVVLG